MGYIYAGMAHVDITPPVPATRWEGKILTGIYRNLFPRILILSQGDQFAVLVLVDLLGISRQLVDRIRRLAGEKANIPAQSIMIAATHSHSTPDTIGSGFEDRDYLDRMVEEIASGIAAAARSLQPVRLGWSKTTIHGFAHSRRVKLKDGQVFTTRYGVPSTWRVNPKFIESQGSIRS